MTRKPLVKGVPSKRYVMLKRRLQAAANLRRGRPPLVRNTAADTPA